MADIYNAGTIGHGSVTLTINSVTYKGENVSPTDTTNQIDRNDETGAHSGIILTQAAKSGSATLQLATSTTAMPEVGMTFKKDLFRAGFEPTWVITMVSPPLVAGEIHKVNINFVKDPAITETAVA